MKNMETAYFAGGCFWCITPTFQEIPGVAQVLSGYCGGREVDPSYEDVKNQKTGHRETIRIDFDPEKVSFSHLMQVYLNGVDPFDAGGQFIDRGHSYTLAVYYCDDDQLQAAKQAIENLQELSGREVCVALESFDRFYMAEEYHQDFHKKNPEKFRQELIESGRIQL